MVIYSVDDVVVSVVRNNLFLRLSLFAFISRPVELGECGFGETIFVLFQFTADVDNFRTVIVLLLC